ncbi:hypothetical protein [Nocardioides sp. TF02-7]|uniref:hypothetical protein n=1 Tax=Nocardioides sp. TF02-7 TaxID=2917724 RepID=UPI001F0532D5|nr:hypothetical protein [Nocardioides sp. TF02-7]UMG91107.1 hypothetical protein MF408_12945 [Nocardioides sp. TF02-7]
MATDDAPDEGPADDDPVVDEMVDGELVAEELVAEDLVDEEPAAEQQDDVELLDEDLLAEDLLADEEELVEDDDLLADDVDELDAGELDAGELDAGALDADEPDVDEPPAEEPDVVAETAPVDLRKDEVAGEVEEPAGDEVEPEPQPQPVAAPAAAAGRTPYTARRGNAGLAPIAILVALACAAVVGRMAYLGTLRDDIGLSATLSGVTAVLLMYAMRATSASRRVHLDEHGVLKVTFGENQHTFDLTSPSTRLEQVGTPGQRGWKVLILRRSMSPVTIDSRTVDPRTFVEALRQWRPEL